MTNISVTIELIQEVAETAEKGKNPDGSPNLPVCLFLLGFKLKSNNEKWSGWATHKNQLIRNNQVPRMVYRTTVFSGKLRNEVSFVDQGEIYYSKQPHFLEDLYNAFPILTSETVPTELLMSIQEVGTASGYMNNYAGRKA